MQQLNKKMSDFKSCNFIKYLLKNRNVFLLTKSRKNHLKKLLTLAEIPSFQKFLFYCPTAQMAEVMVQNVAYRATVYRTGLTSKTCWFYK